MSTTIIRNDIRLDNNLLEEAKKLFKTYGLTLNDGMNLLLKQIVRKKELPISIEPLSPNENDYKFLEQKSKNPDNYVKFDDINWD